MKRARLPKFALPIFMLTAINSVVFSQDCIVDMDVLKGAYTGDCKKGKANGTGKAVGTDTYEGQSKSGLPDGEGTYTWKNGNTFKGVFQKGLKSGDGEMQYKFADKPDSIVKGFWKKDMYVGKYQYPYKVLTKTRKITKADIKFGSTSTGQQITIWVSATSSGAPTIQSGTIPKVQPSLTLQRGIYLRSYVTDTYTSKSETILYDVEYPFQMRLEMGGEAVEFLINEPGSYFVDITINQ